MTTTPSALVIGAGPGLGMSIAHRFGAGGHRVALVSRSVKRHQGYLDDLAAAGVDATAHAADIRDPQQLNAALDAIALEHPRIEVLYYGPGGVDDVFHPVPIADTTSDNVRSAFTWVYPAIDIVQKVLPGMRERGTGSLLIAGGLSGQIPMPALGNLALSAAALRNYALTLNAGLSGMGIYAGTLTIGGLVERGDIYEMVSNDEQLSKMAAGRTLNPDDLADVAWDMHRKRDRPEETFNMLDL